MKASSQNSQAESPKEHSTGNETDEETWEDKLVIDLDTNNMGAADNKVQSKAAASPEAHDSDSSSTKTRESNSTSKTMRSDSAPLGKQKGKRNGQKKGNDVGGSNKVTGKTVKAEKEKATAGKPGRKKKEKQSPMTIKTEAECIDDPYKFDQSNEKIASTATGKSDAKPKNKSSRDAQTDYDWRSVAVVTEPENLGPCEPGTQVCLEGIVWQETNNGVLVVNVTWKGKTYMGTLLDATKHDWSPPSCDSPTGDFEGRTPKGRGKRSRVPLSDTFKDINERKLRKEMRKQSGQNQSRPKSPISPKSESGKRKVRNSEGDSSEPSTKRGKANNSHPQSPPALIECPEPNCGKKYKQMNGLKYHQRNAHRDTSPQVPSDATSDEPEKPEPASSPEASIKPKTEPEVSEDSVTPTKSDSTIRNNTTSVITPTTSNVTNTTASPAGNVPVATITPQVVKPVTPSPDGTDQSRGSNNNQFTGNRSVGISSVPPKLISKPNMNNSSMAPISTITSPGAYSSSLKPIQPKPTILGEVTPNPALHELIDQKKLKRKRSMSKEDIGNPPAYGQIDGQKPPNGGMHKYDTEHRGLLSTGGMINSATDPSAILQSPAYSDISDEGELKNAAARRDLIGRGGMNDSHMQAQNLFPIATVSPQKNAPLLDKDSKRSLNRHMPSHSPVPSRPHEERQKQMPYFPGQTPAWPQDLHTQMMMLAGKDKGSRPVSPKPNPYNKPPSSVPTSREMEAMVNNDRLQLLRENMAMKHSTTLPRADGPRDYTVSSNTSSASDYSSYQELKQREMEQDHHKREILKNLSPASKLQSSSTSKLNDNKFEKMTPRSSPMPPPSNYGHMISNAFLHQQLAFQAMNPMLGRYPPGMAFSPFSLAGMPAESKDNRNTSSPSYSASSKPNHKIHELEGVQLSKSPRPSSTDRHIPSKNQPMSSQAMHSAAALLPYTGAGMHPNIAGMFQPPK